MNKMSNTLWGIILIIIGVIFGLNTLDITDIDVFFDGWWTLFIIVPSFIGLFNESDKTGNIILLIIGVALLLACQDLLQFEIIFKLIVPFILIMIGLSIVFKDAINNKVKKQIKKLNKNNKEEYYATFGSQNIDFNKEEFNGCNLNAVFGGIKCDLRNAVIKSDTVIDISSIFGGVTIYVPDDVNIKISSTPIFGGVSDERRKKNAENKITIYINAVSIFGGVEIK